MLTKGKSHERRTRRPVLRNLLQPGGRGFAVISDYMEHLRRLALHDDAFLEAIAVDGSSFATHVIDERTEALARVAATVAVDGAIASFQRVVAYALAAGATSDEIVATLEAVTPVIGAARTVVCAPKIALALGYDVEQALE